MLLAEGQLWEQARSTEDMWAFKKNQAKSK